MVYPRSSPFQRDRSGGCQVIFSCCGPNGSTDTCLGGPPGTSPSVCTCTQVKCFRNHEKRINIIRHITNLGLNKINNRHYYPKNLHYPLFHCLLFFKQMRNENSFSNKLNEINIYLLSRNRKIILHCTALTSRFLQFLQFITH